MLVTASWQINADTCVNMLHEKLAVVVFRVFLSPLLSSSLSVLWVYGYTKFCHFQDELWQSHFFAYTWHLVWQWRNFFPLSNGITVAGCCFVSQLHLNLQASCSLLCSVLWDSYANLSIKENSCCCNSFFKIFLYFVTAHVNIFWLFILYGLFGFCPLIESVH